MGIMDLKRDEDDCMECFLLRIKAGLFSAKAQRKIQKPRFCVHFAPLRETWLLHSSLLILNF
jgi:hypothetical protein